MIGVILVFVVSIWFAYKLGHYNGKLDGARIEISIWTR